MTDMSYDPEADAVYIRVGTGKIEGTEEAGPFIYDVDSDGRVLGIEILTANQNPCARRLAECALARQSALQRCRVAIRLLLGRIPDRP